MACGYISVLYRGQNCLTKIMKRTRKMTPSQRFRSHYFEVCHGLKRSAPSPQNRQNISALTSIDLLAGTPFGVLGSTKAECGARPPNTFELGFETSLSKH
jgi:hypothetical protein